MSLLPEASAMDGSRSSAMGVNRSGSVRVMAYHSGKTHVFASVRRSVGRSLALEWMRGRSLDSLLSDFEFVGGFPAGIVLLPMQ